MTSMITLRKRGGNLDVFTPKKRFLSILMSCDNIRDPVLLNLLNSLQNEIKCSASPALYLFSSTRLINSMKH